MDYRMSYPIVTGEVVTQGHANYCRDNGHAIHTTDGVVSPFCPRCGDNTAPNEVLYAEIFKLEHTAKETQEAVTLLGFADNRMTHDKGAVKHAEITRRKAQEAKEALYAKLFSLTPAQMAEYRTFCQQAEADGKAAAERQQAERFGTPHRPATAEVPVSAEQVIEFKRVVPGLYALVVDGIERPVLVLRDGNRWLVQHVDAGQRNQRLEAQHYGFRTLHFAKSIAERAWELIRTARALAEAEAYAEAEMIALHAEALEINSSLIYVDGHGSFPYVRVPVPPVFIDGTWYYTVKGANGRGLEWSYPEEIIGRKPFVTVEKCGCEATGHFLPERTLHGYCEVPAGTRHAQFVGLVCDECADTCMKDHMVS